MSEDLLPAEFIAAVAAKAAPNSSVADFVAQQTCARPDGLDRDRLLASLLTTAFRDSAPPPLLKAAVDRGLTSEQDYWTGSRIDLAALALAHSDCDNSLRESALQQCTDSQLGNLGTTDRPTVLTAAVAAELRRRSAGPVPMTRQLLEQPTPAQVVLATSPLADSVFEAALELLPTEPRFALDPDDTDFEGWYAAFRDCMAAWKQMWRSVVQHHADRHLKLVQRTEGTSANGQIRDLLLSEMPWTVEPSLLKDLALADLAGFHAAVLATRLCRERRDGATIPSIRERFADQIDKLDEGGRRRVEMYLDEEGLDPTQFCNQATDWAARAAGGNWRLLLNPTEATHYGDPRPWQASPDDLKTLGRTFAQTTVSALAMWEPDPDRPVPALALLPWTVEVLTHLPIITEEVKAAVGPIIDTARQGLRSGPYRSLYNPDHRDVAELVATIEKIVAEPAPDVAARRSALGDPATVTVRDLARVEPDLLVSYLDRHPGDDALVDKALLALASVSRHSGRPWFREVLERHSDPDVTVFELTQNLRKRLGGNPQAREAWTREVLALPNAGSDLIRVLPAWTALKLSSGYGRTYPEIADMVIGVLGEDASAWERLAKSPIGHSGPAAWLRLGEVLDAALSGADWPKPPPR